MLELPEALNISAQLDFHVSGKTVECVMPPSKAHKFCWYNGDPCDYNDILTGQNAVSAQGFGIFAELAFNGGAKLCFNDGVNARLLPRADIPKNYQLAICFDDATALVFTVAMYGGIMLHDGGYDNSYYIKSKNALSPFSGDFEAYYRRILAESKPSISVKALLATEQRFPGIGNGVLQDILFNAHIHPNRKLSTLDEKEKDALFTSMVSTLDSMTAHGGRDTESDLFGAPGGYQTLMSKNTLATGCPVCGGEVTKEAYLGGSVYYCRHCQPV